MPDHRVIRRLAFAMAAFLITVGLAAAQSNDTIGAPPVAILTAIEGPIGPATVRHVERVIGHAEVRRPEVVVLRLNTPGGLADAMRQIISDLLASPVPVIGYVAPSGAHAASAGTYILYATHIAAMAPGTNLGAATPIAIGRLPEGFPGSDDESADEGSEADRPQGSDGEPDGGGLAPADAMTAKATNDAVALIRSLAEMHGRNADWAERAVREAASLSASAALEMNVIDLVASDVDELLVAIDGRRVTLGGVERVLETSGLALETVEMDTITRILSVLSNPNVALILMMVGIYGLIFEFWNPGALVPGVIGAICLMLGLYALNQLPLNYAGLALLGLGIAFMVAEAVTPTFGILGLGGLVSFVIGAAMLVDTDVPEYQLSWWLIGSLAAVSGAILILLLGFTFRAYRRAPVTSYHRMTGAGARVLEWSGNEGFVWAEGERWHARGSADFEPGQVVQVERVDGLTLFIRPLTGQDLRSRS